MKLILRNITTTVLVASIFITAVPLIKVQAKHNSSYTHGWHEGIKDGHLSVFHQNKIDGDQTGLNDFSQGYVDGWRSTCKEMGLTTGPDSGCELSMDAGTP